MDTEQLRQNLNRWGWKRLKQAKAGNLLARSCPDHLAYLAALWNWNQQQADLRNGSLAASLPPALLRLRKASVPTACSTPPPPPPAPEDPLLRSIWTIALELVTHWSAPKAPPMQETDR